MKHAATRWRSGRLLAATRPGWKLGRAELPAGEHTTRAQMAQNAAPVEEAC